MDKFHTIVIGGGPGGARAAKVLATAGKKVALVSNDLGGECLNYGCIPTKTYLWTADVLEKLATAAEIGLDVSVPRINWQRMKERKNAVVAKLKKNLAFSLQKAGVKIIEGIGKLTSNHAVTVKTATGEQMLEADFFVIATGSETVFPHGFEKSEHVIGSREILELLEVPKTLLIVGGGAIGVEFASLFAALGTRVTIAEMADRLLPAEDADLGAELERVFSRKNIEILKNTAVTPAQAQQYEKVLVAVGRKPAFASLALDTAGIQSDAKKIPTNEKLQTNVPHIFAIGDVAGKALLAYTAERVPEIAAASILGKATDPLDYEKVINTIFSLPEVASVGLREAEVKKRGIEYVVGKAPMSANAKALIVGNRDGFAKIIAEKKSLKLLGIHIIGEKASELIAEASLALMLGLTVNDFKRNLRSHPILDEVMKDACEAI